MRRKMATFLALCLVMVFVVACGNNSGGAADSGNGTSSGTKTTTIKFWYSANDADPSDPHYKWMKDTIDQFQSANPDIKVEPTVVGNVDQYLNKISTEMAANNAPDIFQTWMSGRLEPYVKANRVYPLNEAIDADPAFKEVLNPKNLDTATFDGKIYALPNAMTAEAVFYNSEVFEKYNLSVPETWDDLMNIIKTLKDNGVVPVALGNKDPWAGSIPYMMIYDRLAGPHAFDDVVLKQQAKWNDPSYAEAANKLMELVNAGAFPDNFNGMSYEEALAMFLGGKTGMIFNGTWSHTESVAKLGDKLKFFNFPDIPGGKGSKADDFIINKDEGYAISNASENKEAALKLLKFIFSKERQAANAEIGQLIPTANVPYDKSKVPAVTNELNDALANAKNAMPAWDNPLGQNIGKEFNLTTQAILGGLNIDEAFKKLQVVSERAWSK